MRIDAYNRIGHIYGVDGKTKTATVSKTGKRDKVEISDFGRELQVAKQAVSDSFDIREDKVSEIKARMDNGSYQVSGESFAEKLLAKYDEWMS